MIIGSLLLGLRGAETVAEWLALPVAALFALLWRRALNRQTAQIPSHRAEFELNRSEERFYGLLHAVTDGVILVDHLGQIQLFNGAAERIFGYPAADMIGRAFASLLPEDTGRQHELYFRDPEAVGRDKAIGTMREITARHSSGRLFPIELSLAEQIDPSDHLFIATFRDITLRKQQESKLAVAAAVLQATQEGVVVCDPDVRILWVNQTFTQISGYQPEEVIGRNPSILKSGLQGPEFYAELWNHLLTQGSWSGEIWNRRKDGEAYPEWLTISAVHDETGAVSRYVAVFGDISRHKQAEETIRNLTYYDPVTQLPNRHLFQDRLTQALEAARRRERKVALVLVSLNRFKTVNETFGHQSGDLLLQRVADRLSLAMRSQDTVARLRGDTFVCMLNDLSSGNEANAPITRLMEIFSTSFQLEAHELFVTANLGIALFPLDATDINDLLQKAETAMNRSKEDGENGYQFYTPEMNVNAIERLKLETDLRKAVTRGELEVYFQPKVLAANGKICGAEALVRWRHPELGMVPPSRFIPIAEDTGLISAIGEFVTRTACATWRRWQDEGKNPPRIAINLSPIQIRQGGVVQMVEQILADTGVPPQAIELELTESALMQDAEQAVGMLNRLHDMGVHLSIDDFGTGYSSLSYLRRFPLDCLKIDRSFVQDLGASSAAEEIVSAIIAMAHSLNLNVIAEGVETGIQLERLASLACDEIQGYYFSPPVVADSFIAMIQAGRLDGADYR